MRNRERIAQALVILGSLILFVSAPLHGFGGFRAVFSVLGGGNIPPHVMGALKVVWLMVSWHWVAIGAIALVVSFARTAPRRAVVLLCGLVTLLDAVGGFVAVGPFIGDELLSVAAVAILAGVVLFPSAES
jgi:hypothetical protein